MAGNISKYFYNAAKNKSCADFHHPGETCLQAAVNCCKNGLLGSMKFYLPICVVRKLFSRGNSPNLHSEILPQKFLNLAH